MIFRVPMDDESTMQYFIRFFPSKQRSLKTWRNEVKLGEYKALETDWWGIDVNDQDRMAVEQQGTVADRPNERLGVSDGGIIMMRRLMRESLALMEEGKDPLCIIRDPARQRIVFPQKSSLMSQRQDDPSYAGGFTKQVDPVGA
jgi:5,5'-dehydrodivanillate O-demethylase oxygenase subunit